MKNMLKIIRIAGGILFVLVILLGCEAPNTGDNPTTGTPPLGLAQAYDDANWELLLEDNGTFSYKIPAVDMPALKIGDQVVHAGNELREVVAIVKQSQDILVIHTITGNLARLFPSKSTLSIDSKTMTATVTYADASTRGGSASYTLPLTLKQIRSKDANNQEVVLYDQTQGRSVDLININGSASIINIDETFTQTIFDVSGQGERPLGAKGQLTYNGNAKLTLEEKLKIALGFNVQLYLNYDCGVDWVTHQDVIHYWFFGDQTSTITWWEPVAWQSVNKELKASVSGLAYGGASANFSCNGSVSASYELPLPVQYSYSFLLGYVPVDIGYSAKLVAEAKFEGSLDATTGAYISVNGEFGAVCNNNGWGVIKTYGMDYGYTPPTLSASASISIVPKLENEIRIGVGYQNTGVYGTITLSPYAALEVQAGTGVVGIPWNIACGISGDVGVKAAIVGYELGEYKTQIFDYRKTIAEGTL